VLPGILAAYLVIGAEDAEMVAAVGKNEEGAWVAERAYGALVSRVLPDWLLGFFSAVVVGSILSTFNSVLNSSATLFSLDVYKKFINPDASMKAVVRSGQICSFIVGTFAVIVAPIVFFGQDKIFGFFQSLNGVYFIPLAAIILMGMFNKWVDGKSAVITLLVGLAMMVAGTFFSNGDPGWVKSIFKSGYHYMGFVFVVLLILQSVLSFGMGMKRDEPYVQADAKAVDLTPWKPAPIVGGLLVVLAASIYAFFAM
jgi:SSS family solute:Na+ symporter